MKFAHQKLRPDTITKDEVEKKYYILDAKYYNFGYSKNPQDLPQSSSISKQIGYNSYLRENFKKVENDYKAQSVFILPFSKIDGDDCIKNIGFAERNGNNYEDDRIKVLLIDLKTLIDMYLSNNISYLQTRLIEILHKNV